MTLTMTFKIHIAKFGLYYRRWHSCFTNTPVCIVIWLGQIFSLSYIGMNKDPPDTFLLCIVLNIEPIQTLFHAWFEHQRTQTVFVSIGLNNDRPKEISLVYCFV